ncbi:MAG: hypothetical protein ACT4P7_06500 [Gemmatimonadaceae bacterium]
MPAAAGRLKLVPVFMLVAIVGCGSPPRATTSPNADRSLITREQILEHHFTNVYEAVQALRSNWLLTKGTDSFSTPTEVLVYVDNARMGGVQTLRSIATTSVTYVRYYDGIAATARWGFDHGQGVIFISTGR